MTGDWLMAAWIEVPPLPEADPVLWIASTVSRSIGWSEVTRTSRAPSAHITLPNVSRPPAASPSSSSSTGTAGPNWPPASAKATVSAAVGEPCQWIATWVAVIGSATTRS